MTTGLRLCRKAGRSPQRVYNAAGAIFLAEDRSLAIVSVAEATPSTEREQAQKMQNGTSFREQVRFDEYIARRRSAKREAEGLAPSTDLNVSEVIR